MKQSITLVKSGIGRPLRTKRTLRALGLRRMNKTIHIDPNNKAVAGMVDKVRHLVRVEQPKESTSK